MGFFTLRLCCGAASRFAFAGRVQSVALRLVCDRELEIESFVPREYWSLVATLATPRGDSFEARLVGADGKRIQRLDIAPVRAEAFKQD